jgi:hypothetical protein
MSATVSAFASASAPIAAQPSQSENGNGPSTSPPASRIEEDVDVDADISRLSESTTSPRSHTAKAEVESLAPESSPKDKVPVATTSSTAVKSRKSSCDLCHHRKIRVSLTRQPASQATNRQTLSLTGSCRSVTRPDRLADHASARDTPATTPTRPKEP